MFTAALFTIAKMWWKPKYLSIDEVIKKMRYRYTMEYYSAIQKKKILKYTTCMGHKGIMLGEIRQLWKDKYCMIPFIRDF